MKFFVPAFLLIGILLPHCQAAVYTPANWQDFYRKCSKILGTSEDMKDRNYISDDPDPEVHCFVRCVGILSEFYDDETGNNWDVMAEQYGWNRGFKERRQAAATKCVQALPQYELQSDVCRKAYRIIGCSV